MEKEYSDYKETKFYKHIYNTFPRHAKGYIIKKYPNRLKYKYIPGKEWRELLMEEKKSVNIKLCKFLWKILWKFHFHWYKIISWYEKICRDRASIKIPNMFKHSKLYYGHIHWDLHLKNIIINSSWMFFIDRYSKMGDIMFDFPFIMSFLCMRWETKNSDYIDYIYSFFGTYQNFIPYPKKDFFISFRNNFINYGRIVQKIAEKKTEFWEWKYWEQISNLLINEKNFITFIRKCKQWLI